MLILSFPVTGHMHLAFEIPKNFFSIRCCTTDTATIVTVRMHKQPSQGCWSHLPHMEPHSNLRLHFLSYSFHVLGWWCPLFLVFSCSYVIYLLMVSFISLLSCSGNSLVTLVPESLCWVTSLGLYGMF